MGFEPGNPINAIWYRPGPIILLWAYGRMNLWTVEGGQCTDVFGHLYMYEGSKPQLPNECPADEKSTTVKNATIINAAGSRNLKATRNWFWWRLWGQCSVLYCILFVYHGAHCMNTVISEQSLKLQAVIIISSWYTAGARPPPHVSTHYYYHCKL